MDLRTAYHLVMLLDPEICYRAMKAHDPRFDGCFFIAVSSTRIYCRPVCRVKAPKPENCAFYSSAAAAESKGYRPCLRCRPELAPGNASVDASHRLAQSAASLIEDGLLTEIGMEGLANRLHVTGRHLRRVLQLEFGVSPIALAQTQRLLLAKRLLTDTGLPITEIAFASGFNSLRRFNALFKQRYRLSPAAIRRSPGKAPAAATLNFELCYRPPYDWQALTDFLGARTISGVEEVAASSSYRRIVRVHNYTGWIEVKPNTRKNVMRVTASLSLAKAIPSLLARVKHLFDLSCDPQQISEGLGDLARQHPGLRVPGAFDGFEIAVRAILGQQVSVAAARTLAGRFATAFGAPIESPFAALTTAFPRAEDIAALDVADIVTLGILRSRAMTILALAHSISQGELNLAPATDVTATVDKLQTLPGIGPWTAEYIAMRALAWPDAFPHTDLGLMKALGERNPKRVLARAEGWRPWRSYAVMHLWTGGSDGAIR